MPRACRPGRSTISSSCAWGPSTSPSCNPIPSRTPLPARGPFNLLARGRLHRWATARPSPTSGRARRGPRRPGSTSYGNFASRMRRRAATAARSVDRDIHPNYVSLRGAEDRGQRQACAAAAARPRARPPAARRARRDQPRSDRRRPLAESSRSTKSESGRARAAVRGERQGVRTRARHAAPTPGPPGDGSSSGSPPRPARGITSVSCGCCGWRRSSRCRAGPAQAPSRPLVAGAHGRTTLQAALAADGGSARQRRGDRPAARRPDGRDAAGGDGWDCGATVVGGDRIRCGYAIARDETRSRLALRSRR